MRFHSAAITALALLCATARAAPTIDFCQLAYAQANSTTGWIDFENAQGCLSGFPLHDDLRKATIDTISKTVEGEYSFVDMATVASTIDDGQWTLEDVDLRQFLKAASTKPYPSEKAFHDDIHWTLRQLGDAHTGYRHSCFHSQFTFFQPWGFDVIVDSKTGEQYVRLAAENPTPASLNENIADDLLSKVKSAIGRDPESLRGWKVLSIDGEEPVAFLVSFANTKVGMAKDLNTRFNKATASITVLKNAAVSKSFGPVTINVGMESPASASRVLKVQSPNGNEELVVDVPWFARHRVEGPPTYTDSTSFYINLCAAPPSAQVSSLAMGAQKGNVLVVDDMLEMAVAPASDLSFPNTTENYFGNGYPHLLKEGDFASFMMLDAHTGVSTLPAFTSNTNPPDPFGPVAQACRDSLSDPDVTANIGTGGPAGWRFYCFIKEIHEGLTVLKKNGAKRVILDWTNNGGGWGDLGFAHLALMYPGLSRDQARFRMSPLFSALIEKAFELDLNSTTPLTMYGPANFLDPKTQRAPLPSDVDRFFLDPNAGRNESYGGLTARYSELVNIVDGGAIFDETQEHSVWDAIGVSPPTEPLWERENVMLLTNGFCGSTCAHAARVAVDVVGVRSVVKGGLANEKPFPFSAFPGGNVVDLFQIFNDPTQIDMSDHPLTPRPFLTNVFQFRVNAAVGYSKRRDLPAEYAYKAADCRIDITEETLFPAAAWREAARTFDEGCGGARGGEEVGGGARGPQVAFRVDDDQ